MCQIRSADFEIKLLESHIVDYVISSNNIKRLIVAFVFVKHKEKELKCE